MKARLEGYLAICAALAERKKLLNVSWDEGCTEISDKATLEIPTVSRIVKMMDPSWTGPLLPPSYSPNEGGRVVLQTLGALRDREEWAVRLAPESPLLQADQLHHIVWQAAFGIWETGEYRIAVEQAAVSISTHIKTRAGSTLTDRKLMQQVFSHEAPKSGQVRLHFPGDPSEESWQSRQQGLHLLAQGAFAGIRNVAAHDQATWVEHEALEHLAVLSVIARWADQTELVSAP